MLQEDPAFPSRAESPLHASPHASNCYRLDQLNQSTELMLKYFGISYSSVIRVKRSFAL